MYSSKLLIIEDDNYIAQTLEGAFSNFENHRFAVKTAQDGLAAVDVALKWRPDIVLLDLGLPKMSGREVLQVLHTNLRQAKICILTASTDLDSKLGAFEEGTDDYVIKPFSLQEVLMRVNALVRRGKLIESDKLCVGNLEVNLLSLKVFREGRVLNLTKLEFNLLVYLMKRPGEVISRNELLDTVWGGKDRFPNTVDAHIESLRQKFDKPFNTKLIKTAYREGYYFDLNDFNISE